MTDQPTCCTIASLRSTLRLERDDRGVWWIVSGSPAGEGTKHAIAYFCPWCGERLPPTSEEERARAATLNRQRLLAYLADQRLGGGRS